MGDRKMPALPAIGATGGLISHVGHWASKRLCFGKRAMTTLDQSCNKSSTACIFSGAKVLAACAGAKWMRCAAHRPRAWAHIDNRNCRVLSSVQGEIVRIKWTA